ncbi:MAG: hypothetical protein WC455_09595 [Dehalococcoidia bacterium]|jgi:hypothetical protein
MSKRSLVSQDEAYLTVTASPRMVKKLKTISYLGAKYHFPDDRTLDRMMARITAAHESRNMRTMTKALTELRPFKQKLAFDPANKNHHIPLRDRAIEIAEAKNKARKASTAPGTVERMKTDEEGSSTHGLE